MKNHAPCTEPDDGFKQSGTLRDHWDCLGMGGERSSMVAEFDEVFRGKILSGQDAIEGIEGQAPSRMKEVGNVRSPEAGLPCKKGNGEVTALYSA